MYNDSQDLINNILSDYEYVPKKQYIENLQLENEDKLKGYELYNGKIYKGDYIKYFNKHGKLHWGGFYIKTKENSIVVKQKDQFYDISFSNYIFVKRKRSKIQVEVLNAFYSVGIKS